MTVALDYLHATAPEALGISVAVDDLLKAWFRHGTAQTFICRPANLPSFAHFQDVAAAAGIDRARTIGLDPRTPEHNLKDITCLFRPDPALAEAVWRRQQLDGRGYVACGLVHSLSGEQVSRAVTELCLAPTDSTDALICPSAAIRDAVRNLWDIHADYLNHRFGGAFHCPVQTPVIPLGIDTAKFAARATPEKRHAQRQALNVADDEIVILFTGRLSFATKAHPLPLLLAAERAAQRTKRKLRLVLHGYFKPQADMEPRFRALAQDVCQTVRCDFVLHDDPRFPEGLWAGADVFTSLVDNVQESFGLTPIEAMACGLPAVVTDWDGYREGVRHGQDGFLIPTLAPPAEAGHALATHYFNEPNYGAYLVAAAQSTAVDIDAAATAFVTLADDGALRQSMGQSGQRRAAATYDWRVIIPAYEALWQSLNEQRRRDKPAPALPPNWPAAHPAFPNPWAVFGGFPAATLAPGDTLRVVMTAEEISLILKHDMNLFIPELLLPPASLRALAEGIRNAGSVRLQDLLAASPPSGRARLWRCVGWMLKHGVCAREAT